MVSMASSQGQKSHAVCIPYPAQGHINPMLQLAKILHSKNFHITFVNTEHNHKRLLRSCGPTAVAGSTSFRFETISDGLPPTDLDTPQDVFLLAASTEKHCLIPFKELITRLNKAGDVPPVSCIVSDAAMFFTIEAAREFGIPEVILWTASVCGLLGYIQSPKLVELGIIPFKDENFAKNGDLDLVIDCIPSMKGIRLKDLPTSIRIQNVDDFTFNFVLRMIQNSKRASTILLNSFDALDHAILESISSEFPPFYMLGPMQLHLDCIEPNDDNQIYKSMSAPLWKEDPRCLEWLDSCEPNSVMYVNFGSITTLTNDQLLEFAWGLASSNQPFLWITRPNMVVGEDSAALPSEFLEGTKGRGLIVDWCDQKEVLAHTAIGGFLTHCGWNSTIESIFNGVPMLCWPFFSEQQTNCWFCCNKWGIGMEIDVNVKRTEVERQIRELIDGEKGKEMKRNVMELRKLAHEAVAAPNGSSYNNLDKVIKLLQSTAS